MKSDNKQNQNLMVTIRCLVYNHEPYLRQCLDGFIMQKTNFRFEAIVHDDASTDNSPAIIREYADKYPNIIKPLFENENQYSKHDGSLQKIVNGHIYGKYVALCEGDDYWIDPNKLQKQVDFLEKNQDYAMVHTGFYVVTEKGKKYLDPKYEYFQQKSRSGDVFRLLLRGNYIMTLTTCYRSESFLEPEKIPNSLDYAFFLKVASKKKIGFLSEKMACYRRVPTGATATCPTQIKHCLEENYFYFSMKFLNKLIKERSSLENNRIKIEIIYHYLILFIKRTDTKTLPLIIKKYRMHLYLIPAILLCMEKCVKDVLKLPSYR